MSQDSKPDAIEVQVEKIDVDIQRQEDKLLSDASKKIYNLMFEKIKTTQFTNYMEIITLLMEMIEKMDSPLTAQCKYDTFVEVLQEIIKFGKLTIPSPQKETIVPLLETLDKLLKDDLIKEIVQGLILVSKGKVHLNKMNKRCFCF